ncbi:MAG: VWA domain-containing protein [Sinomicrobium sp.]|nr:VWA domain-containing protein [Sinomicrobium sp.]
MTAQLIVYSLLAAIIALLLAFFQYGKTKSRRRRRYLFITLRFITWFSVLVLLINPQFKQRTYSIEKPELAIAVDNSSSISALEADGAMTRFITALKNNDALRERFRVHWYTFGSALDHSDTVRFTATQTNIAKALQSLREIHKNAIAPTVLLTDGNQTLGTDYQYLTPSYNNPVFPVIFGDTATYTDLSIRRLNLNRYARLNNKFPVEIVIGYDGSGPVNSRFTITSNGAVLYAANLSFSEENDSRIITVELPADKTGVQTMKAEITPVTGEKNTANNTRFFAVEIIDEKAGIAIASAITHPDIGTLKTIMETNQQWEVTVGTPAEIGSQNKDIQLFVLYQPGPGFGDLFNAIAAQKKNAFIITGTHTDWSFLNAAQADFSKNQTGVTEDVQPEYQPGYLPFLTEDIGFGAFPPLQNVLGNISFNSPPDVLLYQKIGNVVTQYPLLATFEVQERRGAVLFGEGIWKWRMEHFRNAKSFEDFDAFFGKLIRYLISEKRKDRLNVFFDAFYYGNAGVTITAEFFDKNYVFSPRASLEIRVKDKNSGAVNTFPMLLKNRSYEVDLSALPASDYEFTVTETGENISRSGAFRIIAFDVEKQFLNADAGKLRRLAANTGGSAFLSGEADRLIRQLLNDERFTPVQKSNENVVPLINWKYLLIIIITALSAEWFLRKYNGLI